MSPRLWKVARSITDTALEGNPGIRSCSSQRLNQRLKISASTLASVNPTHNKTPHAQQNPGGERPDDIDPAFGIPVMLPGAAPGQPCPRGAYPSVRGMSWAKPLSSISTMGRASRSRAHKHQSFPETPAARPGLLSGASGLFICHARFAKRLPYGLRCHIKPRSAIVLAGSGMVYHLLRKLLRVKHSSGYGPGRSVQNRDRRDQRSTPRGSGSCC